MSPSGVTRFLEGLRVRAAARSARIALPEGTDPRVQAAARTLVDSGWARPVLVGEGEPPSALPDNVDWLRADDPVAITLAEERFAERRLNRQAADPDRVRRKAKEAGRDPLVQAALMLAHGDVDGVVAGCVRSTADVLRAALQCVGLAEGCATLSSAFYMILGDGTPDERVLTFTDAGVVPTPSTDQLVDIAASATAARRRVVGDEPAVAFLSYSTHGSAQGPEVARVREAAQRFRSQYPTVTSDGELQGDAALVDEVRARKAPDSALNSPANVLVFPSLDSGNIAYKLVQRLASATALGPILQGLAAPMNDLSRGATAEDIALVSCITAVQAAP